MVNAQLQLENGLFSLQYFYPESQTRINVSFLTALKFKSLDTNYQCKGFDPDQDPGVRVWEL